MPQAYSTVDQFLAAWPRAAEVQALRSTVLNAHPALVEIIAGRDAAIAVVRAWLA